jgi:hypothetical protein
MVPSRRRALRLPALLIGNALIFAFMLSCCNPATTGGPTPTLSICAVDSARAADFPSDACATGAFQPVGGAQQVQIRALDKNGAPLKNTALKLTVSGANAGSASVGTLTATTDATGMATYAYSGSQGGTDHISVGLASGSSKLAGGPAVIHWLPATHATHPVVLVHGIDEDAADFAHEFDPTAIDSDQAGDGSEQTWTALISALTTVYDRHFMEAFCYEDDHAWVTNPSACPSVETKTCDPTATPSTSGPTNACISQSSVDENAVQLAAVIVDLHTRTPGNKPVTLLAYSMGGAIVRTMLAGCLTTPGGPPLAICVQASQVVDTTFFLDGAQQGSWLLTVVKGFNAAALAGQGIPAVGSSPFLSVLPLIEQAIFSLVSQKLGLNLNQQSALDLTPQSPNIDAHNSVQPAPNVDIYTFFGDVRIGLAVNFYIYTLKPSSFLPLGDLVMLGQDDVPTDTPLWGGGALCGSCVGVADGFRQNGRFHEWALTQQYTININGLAPLLSVPGAVSSFGQALNSPVQHLNVSQPVTQAPGSGIQVHDITGLAGAAATDMPDEILLILMHKDGLI